MRECVNGGGGEWDGILGGRAAILVDAGMRGWSQGGGAAIRSLKRWWCGLSCEVDG